MALVVIEKGCYLIMKFCTITVKKTPGWYNSVSHIFAAVGHHVSGTHFIILSAHRLHSGHCQMLARACV